MTESLSGYYVTLEIRQAFDGMSVVIGPAEWLAFGRASAQEMAWGCSEPPVSI